MYVLQQMEVINDIDWLYSPRTVGSTYSNQFVSKLYSLRTVKRIIVVHYRITIKYFSMYKAMFTKNKQSFCRFEFNNWVFVSLHFT